MDNKFKSIKSISPQNLNFFLDDSGIIGTSPCDILDAFSYARTDYPAGKATGCIELIRLDLTKSYKIKSMRRPAIAFQLDFKKGTKWKPAGGSTDYVYKQTDIAFPENNIVLIFGDEKEAKDYFDLKQAEYSTGSWKVVDSYAFIDQDL